MSTDAQEKNSIKESARNYEVKEKSDKDNIIYFNKRELDLLERMIRVEEGLLNINKNFEILTHQIDKRFEQMDKRSEERQHNINKRFEQIDKRFEQMDKRFEDMLHYMNKRFEQVDKRFDSLDKKFNRLLIFMGLGFTMITVLMSLYKFIR